MLNHISHKRVRSTVYRSDVGFIFRETQQLAVRLALLPAPFAVLECVSAAGI